MSEVRTMLPWKVEKCGLEEKHKADPLVVLVMPLVIFIPRIGCDTCMGIVYPLLADDSIRHRVGGMDPTICVLKVHSAMISLLISPDQSSNY